MTGIARFGSRRSGLLALVLVGALACAAAGARQAGASEWTQFAHDPARTGFTTDTVATPWRWKWAWNGPNDGGRLARGKRGLPRNSQPVTGGGRVYVATGKKGVHALDNADGRLLWRRKVPGGSWSTPAYDAATGSVFATGAKGHLYRIDAATGALVASWKFEGRLKSRLALPVVLVGDRVVAPFGNTLVAFDTSTLAVVWQYDAEAPIDTPAAWSTSRGVFVVVDRELFVHAVHGADGTRAWRQRPTTRSGGDPGETRTDLAEAAWGWPVIAEEHGYVLIKYRLDWRSLFHWSPWPATNAEMRANLADDPHYQALFVLDLDDGAVPFATNVGHGGFGDGDYMPMGALPVVRRDAEVGEVAYVVMRGSPCKEEPCDGRWDSHLGEMLLDDSSVAGYQAGDVRFMDNTFFPTDEQPYLSMSGDVLLGGHWAFGLAHRIVDRSASRGAGDAPITVEDLPHISVADNHAPFDASHWFGDFLCAENCGRTFPPGFYIFHSSAPIYDRYWSEYASWVVSGDTVYFVSTDGTVVALEHGEPTSGYAPAAHRPTGGNDNARGRIHAGRSGASSTQALADANAACLLPVAHNGFAAWSSRGPGARHGIESVPMHDVARHSGRTVSVEGTLARVFNNGKAVYLTFREPHRRTFLVRILRSAWANFEEPAEQAWKAGMSVRVQGEVTWYQGGPAIYVTHPDQLTRLPSAPAPLAGDEPELLAQAEPGGQAR